MGEIKFSALLNKKLRRDGPDFFGGFPWTRISRTQLFIGRIYSIIPIL
jgi:hypothetical protein